MGEGIAHERNVLNGLIAHLPCVEGAERAATRRLSYNTMKSKWGCNMWISIKGQKVNLDTISAIIDSEKEIRFQDNGRTFMILSTEHIAGSEDGSGGTPMPSEAEMGAVRTKLAGLGEKWI